MELSVGGARGREGENAGLERGHSETRPLGGQARQWNPQKIKRLYEYINCY